MEELGDQHRSFLFADFKGGFIYTFEGLLEERALDVVCDFLMLSIRLDFDFLNIKYVGFIFCNKYTLKNVVENVKLHSFLFFRLALFCFNILFLPKIEGEIVFGWQSRTFGLELKIWVLRRFDNVNHTFFRVMSLIIIKSWKRQYQTESTNTWF